MHISGERHTAYIEDCQFLRNLGKNLGGAIRASGGELELAERPGPLGGARFVLRLPIATETESRP